MKKLLIGLLLLSSISFAGERVERFRIRHVSWKNIGPYTWSNLFYPIGDSLNEPKNYIGHEIDVNNILIANTSKKDNNRFKYYFDHKDGEDNTVYTYKVNENGSVPWDDMVNTMEDLIEQGPDRFHIFYANRYYDVGITWDSKIAPICYYDGLETNIKTKKSESSIHKFKKRLYTCTEPDFVENRMFGFKDRYIKKRTRKNRLLEMPVAIAVTPFIEIARTIGYVFFGD